MNTNKILCWGRPVFLTLFVVFSLHITAVMAASWVWWLVYAAIVALAVASCSACKGGCGASLCRIVKAIHPALARILAVLGVADCGSGSHSKKPRKHPRRRH